MAGSSEYSLPGMGELRGQLGVLRQVPGMGSSEGRLGVLRQASGELDAVDDAVGCGNGHHLDVLGGLDGILALAHLIREAIRSQSVPN